MFSYNKIPFKISNVSTQKSNGNFICTFNNRLKIKWNNVVLPSVCFIYNLKFKLKNSYVVKVEGDGDGKKVKQVYCSGI